jgi:1-acyl-sn-glycerol-3-phosphate acyltransferase
MLYIYLALIPDKILNKNYLNNSYKQLIQTFSTLLLDSVNTNLFINKNITQEINQNHELFDIIVCNHINSIDFMFIISLLQKFNIKNYNLLFKKELVWLPGFGYASCSGTDIKLSRNFEKDNKYINKQLDNIINSEIKEKQVIIIFAEGTRYSEAKFKEGQLFSRNNNLPIFDNLLVPRTKGLWTIVNHLDKNKKLGNIWDFSLISTNKKSFLELGDIYTIIRKLELNNYQNYLLFKNDFIKNWEIKDKLITNYKNLNWDLVIFDTRYHHISVIIFTIILGTIILFNKYGLIYYGISILVGYLICYSKYYQ